MSAERAVLPGWAIRRLGYQPGQFVEEHQIREGVRRLEHETGRTISLRVEPELPVTLDEAQIREIVDASLAEQVTALTATVTSQVEALRERLAEAERDATAFRTLVAHYNGAGVIPPERWREPTPPAGTRQERLTWLKEHFVSHVCPAYLGAEPVRLVWRRDVTTYYGIAYRGPDGVRVIEARPEGDERFVEQTVQVLFHELGHHVHGDVGPRPQAAEAMDGDRLHEAASESRRKAYGSDQPAGFRELYDLTREREEERAGRFVFEQMERWGIEF